MKNDKSKAKDKDDKPAEEKPDKDISVAPHDAATDSPEDESKKDISIAPHDISAGPPEQDKPEKDISVAPHDASIDPPEDEDRKDISIAPSDATIEDEESKDDEQAVEAGMVAIGTIAIWFKDIKKKFQAFWANKKLRYSTLSGLAVVLVLLFVFPATRYGIFNTVGVRGSARVTVLDQETKLPLKNVEVSVGGASAYSDENGVASIDKVKLGDSQLVIKKSAFAENGKKVRVGFGTNEFGVYELEPIGTQFNFKIVDWLSGEPLNKAEIMYNDSHAFTDSEGNALLTIPPTDETEITVTVFANTYSAQEVKISTTSEETNEVRLVRAPRDYFVSNRDGKFDIYSINLDGTDEKLVLPATGNEGDDVVFSISPENQFAGLVSTRDGGVTEDGYNLRTLNILELESGELTEIDESESIQLIDWVGDHLVYVKTVSGLSGSNPDRNRIFSYNIKSGAKTQLASSNLFSTVMVADGKVYYAQRDVYNVEPEPYLYKVNPDGSSKTTVLQQTVWGIYRTSYEKLVIHTDQNKWYEHDIIAGTTRSLQARPTTLSDKLFVNGPDDAKSVWVEERDGKGVLLIHDSTTNEDTVVYEAAGTTHPVRWIYDNLLIFRVATDQEVADYIINLDGGEPQKITDVTDIKSNNRWY